MIIWCKSETNRVQFKVDEFSSRQSNDNLALIDCALDNCLLARRLPFVDTLIGTNVTNAIWVYLTKTIAC